MDFQPIILGSIPETGPLLARVSDAIVATREAGGIVATVRVAFTPDELDAFPDHSPLGGRMRSIADKVLADAPTTQVAPEIGSRQGDIAVRKIRVGPFGSTDLDARLRAAGVDTLVLTGIQTSGCVLTAARDAHDRDYRVVVLADACADPDVALHEFLVGRILSRQATVMTVADYRRAIGPSGP